MSVDKFGRYSSSFNTATSQGPRGPKGEGFNLTNTGDYDVEYKRICNVGVSTESGDAVNLDTLKNSVAKCLLLNDRNVYDAKRLKICNLGEPENEDDAISMKYFNSNSPRKINDSYSFNFFRIQDVAYPIRDGDVINQKFFNDKALSVDKGNYNAKNLKITNVGNPQSNQDSVNLGYLQSNALILKDANYDAGGHCIKDLGFPRKTRDAINYTFIADVLAEMSFAIYNNFKPKQTKKKITKDEWIRKVTKSLHSCDWGALFGISENALIQPMNDSPINPAINKDDTGVNNQ